MDVMEGALRARSGAGLMREGAYHQYRERLALLAENRVACCAIATIGAAQGWWRANRIWRRCYGRFLPEWAPYASLLFESAGLPQQLCRVEIFETPPDAPLATSQALHDERLGLLWVTRFPSDPQLPTLPSVLQQAARSKVVRYRPLQRCTLRVGDGAETRFVIVFPDDRGERVHAAGQALWQAVGRGELGFMVARLDRWNVAAFALWQRAVPGKPVRKELLGCQGGALAMRLGYAAAGRRPLRPIHGAPHAYLWLSDGTRPGLVDFDRLSKGDPELDIATFSAELDFEKQLQLPVQRIAHAHLAGYTEVAGALNVHLLVAYRAHKRLAKGNAGRACAAPGRRFQVRAASAVRQPPPGEHVGTGTCTPQFSRAAHGHRHVAFSRGRSRAKWQTIHSYSNVEGTGDVSVGRAVLGRKIRPLARVHRPSRLSPDNPSRDNNSARPGLGLASRIDSDNPQADGEVLDGNAWSRRKPADPRHLDESEPLL